MLVSTIISNGQSLADTPNTNFFTASDALFAVQLSWKEIYAHLCEQNDDYFVTKSYLTFSSFTADANRTYAYTYALPSDFYRLRLFQYQPTSDLYFPVDKMTLENFGNLQSGPGYRIAGQYINIFTTNAYTNWCLWYYPEPATLSTGTNLTYPSTMIPEIMSYQVAIEIRRKQNLDFSDKEVRKQELIKAMLRQIVRDDARAEQPKNIFAQGFAPYI